VRRFDRFQQQHAVLGIPIAVVQKFGNDQAGGKAALIAYYGLFALFPLLLLLSTVLGFVLAGHTALQQNLLSSALSNFPIIGTQLQSDTHALKGSAVAVVVGVIGTLYGAQGLGQAALNAMNTIWNVPFKSWPNFFKRRLRGYLWLGSVGLATVAATTIAGFGNLWLHGNLGWVWATSVAAAINLAVFYFVFTVLTAAPLGWRDVIVGVVLATVFWETLQIAGGYYVRNSLAHASNTYGFFAIVIGLLSWLFIAAQLTLLAAEVNVVRRYGLWPRSITQPPLTPADRATFELLARMEERRPEMHVTVTFDPEPSSEPPTEPVADPRTLAEGPSASAAGEQSADAEPLGRPI
jgi:YihY family inner membrane protein